MREMRPYLRLLVLLLVGAAALGAHGVPPVRNLPPRNGVRERLPDLQALFLRLGAPFLATLDPEGARWVGGPVALWGKYRDPVLPGVRLGCGTPQHGGCVRVEEIGASTLFLGTEEKSGCRVAGVDLTGFRFDPPNVPLARPGRREPGIPRELAGRMQVLCKQIQRGPDGEPESAIWATTPLFVDELPEGLRQELFRASSYFTQAPLDRTMDRFRLIRRRLDQELGAEAWRWETPRQVASFGANGAVGSGSWVLRASAGTSGVSVAVEPISDEIVELVVWEACRAPIALYP